MWSMCFGQRQLIALWILNFMGTNIPYVNNLTTVRQRNTIEKLRLNIFEGWIIGCSKLTLHEKQKNVATFYTSENQILCWKCCRLIVFQYLFNFYHWLFAFTLILFRINFVHLHFLQNRTMILSIGQKNIMSKCYHHLFNQLKALRLDVALNVFNVNNLLILCILHLSNYWKKNQLVTINRIFDHSAVTSLSIK